MKMLFICPLFTDVSERDISSGLFSRQAKTQNLRHLRRWFFMFHTFLEDSFFTTVLPPFCASFHNLPSHILSSCLLVYLSYFSSRSLHFSFTYSISSVHWTRCSRLWCHPLADSIYVLLSPGFNSSEQQGFQGTVSWKDTEHWTCAAAKGNSSLFLSETNTLLWGTLLVWPNTEAR